NCMSGRLSVSPGRHQEVIRDALTEVAKPRLEAIQKWRNAFGGHLFEPTEVELSMQLANSTQRFGGLAVGHRREVRVKLVEAAVHALREVVTHQQHLGYPNGGDAVAVQPTKDLERGHRAQQHRPFGGFCKQALATATRVTPS